jgi:hypothetical protein
LASHPPTALCPNHCAMPCLVRAAVLWRWQQQALSALRACDLFIPLPVQILRFWPWQLGRCLQQRAPAEPGRALPRACKAAFIHDQCSLRALPASMLPGSDVAPTPHAVPCHAGVLQAEEGESRPGSPPGSLKLAGEPAQQVMAAIEASGLGVGGQEGGHPPPGHGHMRRASSAQSGHEMHVVRACLPTHKPRWRACSLAGWLACSPDPALLSV